MKGKAEGGRMKAWLCKTHHPAFRHPLSAFRLALASPDLWTAYIFLDFLRPTGIVCGAVKTLTTWI
jgi:hypothetical protein